MICMTYSRKPLKEIQDIRSGKTEVTTQRRWSFVAKEQTLLMAMLLILSNEKNDFFWDHLKLYE